MLCDYKVKSDDRWKNHLSEIGSEEPEDCVQPTRKMKPTAINQSTEFEFESVFHFLFRSFHEV